MECCVCGVGQKEGHLGSTVAECDGKPYCILHSPDWEKDVNEFGYFLSKQISCEKESACIDEVIFPDNFVFHLFCDAIEFYNCKAKRLVMVGEIYEAPLKIILIGMTAESVRLDRGNVNQFVIQSSNCDIERLRVSRFEEMYADNSRFNKLFIGDIRFRFKLLFCEINEYLSAQTPSCGKDALVQYGNTIHPQGVTSSLVEMFDWKRTSATTLKMDYSKLTREQLKDKEHAFGALKVIAQNELYHSRVSDWHYLEKRAALERIKKDREHWPYPFLTLLFWYHVSSKFGESFKRAGGVLGVLLAVVFVLAGIESWFAFPTTAGVAPISAGVNATAAGVGATVAATDALGVGGWESFGRVLANFVDYLPAARIVGEHQGGMRLVVYVSKILLALQAALLGFALRNRFRR